MYFLNHQRTALLISVLVGSVGCDRSAAPAAAGASSGDAEVARTLARLEGFAGTWRCLLHYEANSDEPARDGRAKLSIVLEEKEARWSVSLATEPGEAEAFQSQTYWHYDKPTARFVHHAVVGSGDARVSEEYFSPGPAGDRLVWEGDLEGAMSVPMRVTYHRAGEGTLEVSNDALVEGAWKPLSKAACRKG